MIEYKLDAFGRRIVKLMNSQVQEYYLWYDQTKLAAILNADKSIKLVYIYGPESDFVPSFVIKDNQSYKIVHDPGTNSVRYIIDTANSTIIQELEYDEYGNIMKNTNPTFQPLGFAGGLRDTDTKLIRFGARDYDSTVGRWTTKDPIGFNGGDPMSRVDPNGESPMYLIPALILTTILVVSEVQDYQNDPFYLIKRQLLLDNLLNKFKKEEREGLGHESAKK